MRSESRATLAARPSLGVADAATPLSAAACARVTLAALLLLQQSNTLAVHAGRPPLSKSERNDDNRC